MKLLILALTVLASSRFALATVSPATNHRTKLERNFERLRDGMRMDNVQATFKDKGFELRGVNKAEDEKTLLFIHGHELVSCKFRIGRLVNYFYQANAVHDFRKPSERTKYLPKFATYD